MNGTLFGLGERCGNPPLEGAIIEYISLKGGLNGIDTTMITELAQYYEKVIGTHLAPNYPFVGKDFNTTRAGIHAGGLRKFEQIYNIFDTTALLKRPPRVSITDKSGTDGVALWVNDFLQLKGEQKLSVMKVARIQRWVMDQYEIEGRMSSITDEEMEEQVKVNLPDYYARVNGNHK
jgi:isopropylmalate/homocitrate/citramalate synthase